MDRLSLVKPIVTLGTKLFCIAFFIAASLSFFLAGCATLRNERFASVDSHVYNNNYAAAIELIEQENNPYDPILDLVLRHIDLGLLYYYDNQPKKSVQHLDMAENLVEEYYTKSVSQFTASLLINDNLIEYPGEDFEDLYINIFKSLNYIALGEYESAFVEIRRINDKVAFFETKYNQLNNKLRDEAYENELNNDWESLSSESAEHAFSASALGYYLGMLLYELEGDKSDAEISYNNIIELFENNAIYDFPLPNISNPSDHNGTIDNPRIGILAFADRSPIKIEQRTQHGSFVISIPEMTPQSRLVDNVRLVDSKDVHIADFDLLEPIGDVVIDTFNRRKHHIYSKTFIRAAIKAILAETTDILLREANIPILGDILKIGVIASEQADLRSSRYIPQSVYLLDMIAPDTFDSNMRVQFIDRNGDILCQEPLFNGHLVRRSVVIASFACIR